MSKQHRFTGSELTTLLEQVREELGAEATIVEANKVRTGGIAGFFTNEKFEVIATPSDHDTIDLDDRIGVQLDLVEPTIANGAAQRLVASADERDTVDIRTATVSASSAANSSATNHGTARRGDLSDTAAAAAALLERVETISISDRIGLSRPTAEVQTKSAPPPEIRFGDILSSELQQPEISIRTTETDDFWTHLEELEAEVERLDLDSRIIVVVGNRSAALSVAQRIETADDGEARALVAITPSPDEIDLPAWQQVENEIELGDRLRFWNNSERQGIVIVDADFGADATSLVERVRSAGSRLLHLAVDDELSPKRIFDLMQRLGGNVVIDLAFRPEPAYVLSLVDRGVPLASVDGHTFDANLLLALNREVQRG